MGNYINADTEFIYIYDHSSDENELRIVQKEKKYLRLIDEADACSACYTIASAMEKLNEMGLQTALLIRYASDRLTGGIKDILESGTVLPVLKSTCRDALLMLIQ